MIDGNSKTADAARAAGTIDRRYRVLMVGPMPRAGTPIGGTQVSFHQCVDRLRRGGRWDVDVIDTSRVVHDGSSLRRAARNAQLLASVLGAVARRARRNDVVVLNMSSGALLRAGPLVCEATRLLSVPLVVRAFGGCLDDAYDALTPLGRHWVDQTLFRSPLVLLQTQALCRRFASVEGARWMPTTRDCPETFEPPRARCRRFLFLSQVRAEKGVLELLEASRRLPAHVSVTVRGPILPGLDARVFDGHPRVVYGGPAEPSEVAGLLAQHDALVFPTWYSGEGIPGVVVEALQAGRPVIASSWRALPDVVSDGVSGILVPPRDVDALSDALQRLSLSPSLYARLARGARARGLDFDAQGWHRRFESWLVQVAEDELPAPVSEPIRAASPTPAERPQPADEQRIEETVS